mmetsp:Transcript_10020/g.26005  ORF Transcript_10020/g.26005 Transcript_10020/m.26005 type:complete len:139 (+) Transcript_10020:324-740(+)
MSGRSDMTPPRWQEALAILQNDMPSDSRAEIDATLKEAFCRGRGTTGRGEAAAGRPKGEQVKTESSVSSETGYSTLVDIFDEFDYEPIASASIAQVHRARLAATKEEVAVKVMHRGVEKVFLTDMQRAIRITEVRGEG